MWSHHFITLYRALTRHRLYSALNVLGLAAGIAVFLLLLLAVRFETSYDRWVPNAEDIYRVDSVHTFPGQPVSRDRTAPGILYPLLTSQFPQVQSAVRLLENDVAVRQGGRSDFETIVLADPNLFDVFDLPLVSGSRATALGDTASIVIDESMARKYFGTTDALGKHLTLVVDGPARDYRVSAVMKDLPLNSHMNFHAVARLDRVVLQDETAKLLFESWGSGMAYTYVRLKPGAEVAAMQAGMKPLVDRFVTDFSDKPSDLISFSLSPLLKLHFLDVGTRTTGRPGVDPLLVATLALVGVTALLIAICNFINLATARAGLRAREVALRKVMGATRGALMVQFLTESMIITLVSTLIGVALVELALPFVGAMLGQPLKLVYFGEGGLALPLALLVLVIGLGSGLYPALILSKYQPAGVLASARTPGGGRAGARVRQGLVVLQFGVSTALIICTAVIFAQTQYVRRADVGFQREGLLLVSGFKDPAVALRRDAVMDAFRRRPGVQSVTISDRSPAGGDQSSSNMRRPGRKGLEPFMVFESIGPDYFRTYGLKTLAGRALDTAHGLDDVKGLRGKPLAERGVNVVINAEAARVLEFSNPQDAIGKVVSWGSGDVRSTVVGVVGDTRFLSPREKVLPIAYLMDTVVDLKSPSGAVAAVRYAGVDGRVLLNSLKTDWDASASGLPFQGVTISERLAPYYQPDERRSNLFMVGSVLAVLIGCIGLYGLASFNTMRRVREIGIRKTLGASTTDVLTLLLRQMLTPVMLANLIAWPLAFFAMRAWLSSFDQRIGLNPGYFLAASLLAAGIAAATVVGQAIKLARSEPARALRYE